jgi:hypothetical protein
MAETAPIVRELMAEVRMEVREYDADAQYLLQFLGQMFQRAYDAGRADERPLSTAVLSKRQAED